MVRTTVRKDGVPHDPDPDPDRDRDRLIAVVGMSGRFPGAPDVDAFWDLLTSRGDAIRPVPADRWDASAQLDPEKDIQAVGGFLEDVDRFDPTFFGVSPREAESTDPQHRLLLEESWRVLEDAGRPAADLRDSRTGVYVGASWHDYEILGRERGRGVGQHSAIGNALDMTATRISYFLGLRGPSMAVETGCSSGLVALHLAAQALRNGEIDGALVGAVSLMLDPHMTVGLTHFGGLSPTGRCHAFSADADGFVRGEGVVMFYLKTLDRALADDDRVHGVIARTVVTNDGGGDSLVTPSPAGQEALLTEAYGDGGIPLDRLAYVEAHGTGTRRGDPIEAGAIGRILGQRRDPARGRLGIGSVKTNIGHLEPAAGLAGMAKSLLALRHGVVPPSLHSETLNPDIPFDELGLEVVREPLPLPQDGPVYIGVNSFGWGGTNAHAVLMAAPPTTMTIEEPEPPSSAPVLLPLSAHGEDTLRERARDLARMLDAGPGAPGPGAPGPDVSGPDVSGPGPLAMTLARRRDHFPVRAAFVGESAEDLARALRSFAADPQAETPDVEVGRARPRGRTAFVFPGQGSQWAGMGRELHARSEVFASVVRRCAKALEPHWDADLEAIVSGRAGDEWMSRIDLLQPVLWAVSLGLAELWREAGVIPDVVVGHSQGEVTAATLAGILSYEDAALVMARRSAIARRTSGNGRMLAVDLDAQAAVRALSGFEGKVSLAVDNGPNSCVLSGDTDAVLLLKEKLEAAGTYCRLVNVDYASHSPQMDPLREDLLEALEPVRPQQGELPLMSTVRVCPLRGPEMNAAYWTANLRQPVYFADAMSALFDEGVTHVVEVSPHPVLVPAIEQLAAACPEPPAVMGTLRRDAGTPGHLARAFARAYVRGLEPFGGVPVGAPVPVPGYPWRRDRHWIGSRTGRAGSHGALSFTLTPRAGERDVWESTGELSLDGHPWLRDHQVDEAVVLPGAAMLSFALDAARAHQGAVPAALSGVAFRDHLTLTDEPVRLGLLWRDAVPPAADLSVLSLAPGATEWTEHATVRVERHRPPAEPAPFPEALAATAEGGPEEFYAACAARGLRYGPSFQGVRALHRDGPAALGRLRLPDRCRSGSRSYALHPALWDAAMQVSLAVVEGEQPVVPVAVDRVHLHADFTEPLLDLWAHAVRRDAQRVDLFLYDADRQPLLTMEGLVLQPLAVAGEAGFDAERELRLRFQAAGRQQAEQAEQAVGHWTVCGDSGNGAEEGDGSGAAAQRLGAALTAGGADATVISFPEGGEEAAWAGRAGEGGLPDVLVFVVPPAAAGLAEQRRSLSTLTALVRAALSSGTAPRLAVVTSGAQSVTGADRPDPGGALFWGYTRALRREHPELRPVLLDAEPDPDGADWATEIAAELLTGDEEDQVALREGRRYVGRLVRGAEGVSARLADVADLADPVGPVDPASLAGLADGGVGDSAETLTGGGEDQVALREGRRYLGRLVPGAEGNSARLADVADLADPVNPADPAVSVNPSDPVNSVNAADPVNPVDPADGGAGDSAELLTGDGEDRVALRGGQRYVGRLVRGAEGNSARPADLADPASPADPADPADSRPGDSVEDVPGVGAAVPWQGPPQPFRLASGRPGLGDRPCYLPLERRAPGTGEVEVAVTAAALRPTDTVNAPSAAAATRTGAATGAGAGAATGTGAAPATGTGTGTGTGAGAAVGTGAGAGAGAATATATGTGTGIEPRGVGCVGRVVAVGGEVAGVRPGDRVVACASGPLGTHLTVRADHTRRIPAGLTDADAAALVLVAATAWHGLVDLARAADGETVLVHSGVGAPTEAAVRVARLLGATPLATASSQAQLDRLRELGVEHVFDVSDPEWAQRVRAATGGRGVDVVLSSVAGPSLRLGLEVLAEDGRFVQTGADALHDSCTIGPDALRKGITLATADVERLMVRRPERFARLLETVWQHVEAGELTPPPVTTYTFGKISEALREMSRGTGSGAVVLVQPETVGEVAPEPLPDGRFRANGTYVISGGLGALGLSLAEFLAAQGAGALALLGRAAPSEEALRRVADLRSAGTRVVTVRADVTDADAVDRALALVRAELPPLRGVFHAAGLLDDATVLGLRPEQLERVLAPKVDGARNLDRATVGDPLDLFVLFSSAAALVGNAGQAAYAAANAYLDAFAEARRRRGRPALSVQWGPFEEIGLAATDTARGDWLAERGMGGFGAQEAWQALVRFLGRDEPVRGYVPLDLPRWFAAYPDTAELPSWRLLRQTSGDGRDAALTGSGFLARLATAEHREWPALIETRMLQLAGSVLRLDVKAIGAEVSFKALGLDSLMSLELRNRLEADLGLKLSPTLLWTHGNARALSGVLSRRLAEASAPTTANPTP
ncbi:SDR family NAD(P)-dependent oxidoreductase [Streptomyces sp. NPDC005474]|uniref:type I polyketide synthase n=1 Tax=Streptomyces sp. NPDC005474 TaxID=3154878 RepID=UPI003451C944